MEKKKHKILKRVVPVLCAVLVLGIALITPISAIVNSSQGSFNDYDITACSSFPLTVGFSYSTRDLSTGLGNSYVYSTYVGQFGEEFNKTIEGDEEYTLVYDAGNGLSPYNLTGRLSYTMLGQHWNETVYVNGASGAEGYFRRGYNGIMATNNTPASGNVSGYQQGVVLKASDVVFNPRSVYTITEEIVDDSVVQNLDVITDPNVLVNVMPTFKTPDIVENEGGYGVTLTYSYNVKLRTPDNQEITFSDTATYDNRTEGYVGREIVPIIDPHALIGVSGGYYFDTIVIEDYNGYLEYKYYTYTAPTISFTVGENSYTTQEGTTWQEFATTTDGFRYLDTAEGTGIQYEVAENTWSEINYNEVAVGPTDVIISGATYTITEPATEDALAGTWVFNTTVNPADASYDISVDGSFYGKESDSSDVPVVTTLAMIELRASVRYVRFSSNSDAYPLRKTHYVFSTTNWGSVYYADAEATASAVTYDYRSEEAELARTITIVSKLSEVENGEVLLSYLQANATKQTSAPTISFTVGENSYTTQEGTTWQEFATTTDGFRYADVSEGTGIQYEVAENTWSEIYYNNVAVGPTDVIISGATYTITQPVTEETLAGTWVFNSSIDLLYEDEGATALVATFPFTDGYGNSYERFAISMSSGKINYINDTTSTTINAYTGSAWVNSAYQTITTTASIDDVTVAPTSFTSQEFMTWLTTNAVKSDTVTTLSYNTDDDFNYSSEANAVKLATTSSGTWNEVNRSESCELELTYPLLDVSNVVNTGSNAYNSYYRWYSFPTVEKLLTSAEYAEAIPLPEVPQVDMTSWIGTAVGGFLNMELMPYFSIGGLLAIVIGFSIFVMILKLFAGG